MTSRYATAQEHVRAWSWMLAALALHVADETFTNFLAFYNPLVLRIRNRITWFPMPTFDFWTWLAGLIALIVTLAALAPIIRRGTATARAMSWILSGLMLLNGVGHLAGSWYFDRWLPGASSAPLLVAASVHLAQVTARRRPGQAEPNSER